MHSLINHWIAGPALSLYRYNKSRKETAKLRVLQNKFTEYHLSDCKAYTDRARLIESFGHADSIAEVGVAQGAFSEKIFNLSHPKKLYLIDYWKENRRGHGVTAFTKSSEDSDFDKVKNRFSTEIKSGSVELIREWSWNGLEQLEDESLDWVYLDAGHDFESVCKDLEVSLRKIKKNGVIAGHDYVRWGRFGYRCGVIEAVTKFCIENDFKIVGLTFEHNYPPSYALKRI